ncbi:uncharacterized protein TRUGW13939_11368 [Talaromyces rugulosus]|uniref:Aminoglycoside phosphotransferase domain-containing protein n=1 Tax=Talaromyces rugulosus TaxID=121627 RepID=A0A7H8RF67_TALRU|nr:uncharacterized protein TRUGW13939_11368 [Talaromyces rugulosus]QKX64195.1 hypothetical protein TRUGW13939_11368 [Talaromyces rugulosus]
MTCAEENSSPKKTVSQFLSEWKVVIDKLRPTRATSLSDETRMLIYKRDGGCCCLTGTPFKSYSDRELEYVQMISPLAFSDLSKGYYVAPNAFQHGPCLYDSLSTNTMIVENRTPELTPILNADLLDFHAHFSKPLAWIEIRKRINTSPSTIGLAAKYHAEAHTLRLVEQSTHIPAPRAIDVLKTPRFSYLLMTCVPGRPIGQLIDSMTDEELKQVVTDLKEYVAELRTIPNQTTEFQICNSEGGGILDWRIPDSQREELRFKTEAEFNKYLTGYVVEEYRRRASISHNVRHEIFFTHGDLNLRNILAENGKITGIVDWENAGWFPEYWEYTKAHYTVRSEIHWLADVVDRVFEGYREELVVENMLSDRFGPF